MKDQAPTRLSLIDGSLETVEQPQVATQPGLEPIYEEVLVQVPTPFGVEEIRRKRIIGFRERQS